MPGISLYRRSLNRSSTVQLKGFILLNPTTQPDLNIAITVKEKKKERKKERKKGIISSAEDFYFSLNF